MIRLADVPFLQLWFIQQQLSCFRLVLFLVFFPVLFFDREVPPYGWTESWPTSIPAKRMSHAI
jgi:hypothetical protein